MHYDVIFLRILLVTDFRNNYMAKQETLEEKSLVEQKMRKKQTKKKLLQNFLYLSRNRGKG